MRILITGGTGFLGRALLRNLQQGEDNKKNTITVISSGRTQIDPSFDINLVQADLTDLSSITAFASQKYDTVIHLATMSTLGPKYSEVQRYQDIITIDRNVLDIVKIVGAGKLIWASSGAVYGPLSHYSETQEHKKICLDDLFNTSAYRLGKIQSEYHAAKFTEANHIKLHIIRLFTFAGVDLPLTAHFALGNFIHDAFTEKCINIQGTGMARRSYMNQNNFAQIVSELSVLSSPDITTINVGSSVAYTLSQVADMVRQSFIRILGETVQIKIHNKMDDSNNYYVPDTTRLHQTFPHLKLIDLETTIDEIITRLVNSKNLT